MVRALYPAHAEVVGLTPAAGVDPDRHSDEVADRLSYLHDPSVDVIIPTATAAGEFLASEIFGHREDIARSCTHLGSPRWHVSDLRM